MANSKLTKKRRVYLLFAIVAFIGLSNAAERCRKLAGKETSSKTGHFNIMYCLDGGSGSAVCAVKEAVKLYVYSIRTSHVERAKSIAMEGAMTDALSQGMSVKQANKEAQKAASRAARMATRQADRILGPIVSSGWDLLEAFYFGGSVTEGSLRSSGTLIGTYLVGFLGEQSQVVQKILHLYHQISKLDSLKPSKDVDTLFTQLVHTCIPPSPVDVSALCSVIQEKRSHLIRLCAEAEGLLESHYSRLLASLPNPLRSLALFPYYDNYLRLAELEFGLLAGHCGTGPGRVALVGSDPELSRRMAFHTGDIMDATSELGGYGVVFLAALVGMDKEEKGRVVDHLARHMAPGALLMVRSAHGARAFLYPVVDPRDLRGFEVLRVHHPTDEVINSVIIARKMHPASVVHQSYDQSVGSGSVALPIKCSCVEIHTLNNPFNKVSIIVEELAIDHE
ncbi:unnamed protein product [Cuscuta campestris]|uniref:Nicotianamine synthase n=1 Tax=Cuscuta campestris TaxID=132261 RepID=A0A484NPB8_9ASTE|nr:unnamed protein product [Cuscuta campestris]